MRKQHAFVDDGAARHRRNVKFLAVPKFQRLDRVAGFLANDVEFALERILVRGVGPARDKYLTDHRLDFFRSLGQTRIVRRHVSPAE